MNASPVTRRDATIEIDEKDLTRVIAASLAAATIEILGGQADLEDADAMPVIIDGTSRHAWVKHLVIGGSHVTDVVLAMSGEDDDTVTVMILEDKHGWEARQVLYTHGTDIEPEIGAFN
jgi:hypothetical protein